jgi:hypothetical protein
MSFLWKDNPCRGVEVHKPEGDLAKRLMNKIIFGDKHQMYDR